LAVLEDEDEDAERDFGDAQVRTRALARGTKAERMRVLRWRNSELGMKSAIAVMVMVVVGECDGFGGVGEGNGEAVIC
jgi:hypothetical protein